MAENDKKESTRSGSPRGSNERGRSPTRKRHNSRSASRSGSAKKRYSKSRSPRKRSASSSPVNIGNVLYFAGLHVNTREQDLEDICSKYGSVHSVQIIYDPRTEESRGFAFVTMGNDKEADAVLSNLNGRELDGKALTIEKARRSMPRKPTPGKYLGKLNNRSRFVRNDRFDRRYDYPPPRYPYERYSPPLEEAEAEAEEEEEVEELDTDVLPLVPIGMTHLVTGGRLLLAAPVAVVTEGTALPVITMIEGIDR